MKAQELWPLGTSGGGWCRFDGWGGQGFPGQGPGQLAPGLELQIVGILGPWPVSLGSLNSQKMVGDKGVQTVPPTSGLGFSWRQALCKEAMSPGEGLRRLGKAAESAG